MINFDHLERSSKMSKYSLKTPQKTRQELAARLKELRLAKGWRQVTLAERSGVSLGSLRRFETSGRVSVDNLLKLAFALRRLDDFDGLFELPRARTMAELEEQEKRKQARRKRGKI